MRDRRLLGRLRCRVPRGGGCGILIGVGLGAAIHRGHGRHCGLTGIAFLGNPLLLFTQFLIERPKGVIEAFVQSRMTFIRGLRTIR